MYLTKVLALCIISPYAVDQLNKAYYLVSGEHDLCEKCSLLAAHFLYESAFRCYM
uniref:Uncharacterized protein n=1 Tax=Arundo donax TaxID=35708 RepID=A0A0A9FX87_ARUDO